MTTELKGYDELMEFQVRRLCDMIKCGTEHEYQEARRDVTASRLAIKKLKYDRFHRQLTDEEVMNIYRKRGQFMMKEVADQHEVSIPIVRSIWYKWTYRHILKDVDR